jgi:hypothetical protein
MLGTNDYSARRDKQVSKYHTFSFKSYLNCIYAFEMPCFLIFTSNRFTGLIGMNIGAHVLYNSYFRFTE